MSAKLVLGGLAGIGLITTVSVVSSNRRGSSFDTSWTKHMPEFEFLSSDFDFSNKPEDNPPYRFGYKYRGLLVDNLHPDSEEWWKWSYGNLKKDSRRNGKSLEKAFADASATVPDSIESLKSWCRAVYEVNTYEYEPVDYPSSLFNNTSVWKYCSPIQQSPVSLKKSNVSYPAETIGYVAAPILLDTNKNGRIWYYRNKFFDEIKATAFKEDRSHPDFIDGAKRDKKVVDICANVYNQNIAGASIHKDVMFFCSISQLI